MNRVPLPELPGRVPDSQSERRLTDLRLEAARSGVVSAKGVTPEGALFPQASPTSGSTIACDLDITRKPSSPR